MKQPQNITYNINNTFAIEGSFEGLLRQFFQGESNFLSFGLSNAFMLSELLHKLKFIPHYCKRCFFNTIIRSVVARRSGQDQKLDVKIMNIGAVTKQNIHSKTNLGMIETCLEAVRYVQKQKQI